MWNIFRSSATAPVSAAPLHATTEQERWRLGAQVTIDRLALRTLADPVTAAPDGPQAIEAVGTIDLGQGEELRRYYLADNSFVQLHLSNGHVIERLYVVYQEGIDPDDAAHFRALVCNEGPIGAPTLEVDGRTFRRVWGDDHPNRWTPPVQLEENVVKSGASYSLTLYTMLYGRHLGAPQTAADGRVDGPSNGAVEMAFITGEDGGEDAGDFCVSIATGVPLNAADIDVV